MRLLAPPAGAESPPICVPERPDQLLSCEALASFGCPDRERVLHAWAAVTYQVPANVRPTAK
jgi:hypothetical protein